MILLDSDHLSVLRFHASERRQRLVARLASAIGEEVGVTIVNVEEQMRGWLAAIAKERQFSRQALSYRELARLFDFFTEYRIVLIDEMAIARHEEIRSIRIGAMDLKIASIALANNALLLTANRQDFEKIPGLRFENWLD